MKNSTFGTRFRWVFCFASIVLFAASGCQTKSPPPSEESLKAGAFARTHSEAVDEAADSNIGFGVPLTEEPVQKLVNVGYTVGYSARTKTPLWVSYRLFETSDPSPPRDDVFAADTRVATPVKATDYERSGYDRGHMAPSSPIGKRYGKAAQDATFKMTNMVPQLPGLNQRGWEALERIISTDWAQNFKELWVISGPVFSGPCKELLSDVSVPASCYMIIAYRTSANKVKALGVIMPQRRVNQEPLDLFVVPIDEIERETGIDFLRSLPDNVEEEIEAADKTRADPSWNISQLLQPTFPAPARPIQIRDCN